MTENMQKLEIARFITENAYNVPGNALMESVQANVTDVVLSKMFELTIGKYNKIDFSEIERSRGDVTKTKFYNNLNECINTLIDIHTVTNKIPSILIVSDALNNLRSMKNILEYNFRIKNNCAIMIYNTIYYAIMEATSYIIAASIDISKEETGNVVGINIHELDTKAFILINSLTSFNKCVADNSIIKFLKHTEEESSVQNESAIADATIGIITDFIRNNKTKLAKGTMIGGAVLAVLYLGTHIIPIIREIVYWIYRARHKISEDAAMQAEFLELNIESLQHMDPNAIVGRTKILRRKKITAEKLISRQTKHANRFRAIANKFALDSDKTSRDAKIDVKSDKVDVSAVVI